MTPISHAVELLAMAKRLCVLTGAGVSAESGIPTFRASDGLWDGHSIEEVATPSGWKRNPQLVWDFYHARRATAGSVTPNPGHVALAEIERDFGKDVTLATQNVDGLHRAAGSVSVLELHGSLRRTRCTDCGKVEDRGYDTLPPMPTCACGAVARPDIVWFHEMLPQDVWRKAERAASTCDLFFVVGTSAVVYPAAGLIDVAKGGGATVVEFNLTKTDASERVDLSLFGKSGETLPALVAEMRTRLRA
jgi:NAD-dependent deacetylase